MLTALAGARARARLWFLTLVPTVDAKMGHRAFVPLPKKASWLRQDFARILFVRILRLRAFGASLRMTSLRGSLLGSG
jgi:hypothetical protein